MPTNLQELHDAGVHLGHQLRRFNPRSKKFVYDHRQGISIINLEKTLSQLNASCEFIRNVVAHGKKVLFVGTKAVAKEVIEEVATATGMPYATSRWVGGTLTNYSTISATLKTYKKHQTMIEDGSMDKLPNKEAAAIKREMTRQKRYFEGLMEMAGMPGAIFVVDVKEEKNAVNEAKNMRIPLVGMVDTNADPTGIAYPIPANDDALKSIRLILDQVKEAIEKGLEEKGLRQAEKTGVDSTEQVYKIGEEPDAKPEVQERPRRGGPRGRGNDNARGDNKPQVMR